MPAPLPIAVKRSRLPLIAAVMIAIIAAAIAVTLFVRKNGKRAG